MKRLITIIINITITLSHILAVGPVDRKNENLAKAATTEFVLYEGNNIRNWIGNQGHLSSQIPTGDAGCEWPIGSGLTAIFSEGVWVLGQVDGDIRSAAAEFTSEWLPGTIPYDTQLQQPTSTTPMNTTLDQVYFINRGQSSDPASDGYNWEYAGWPASQGAPAHDGEYYTDTNDNGTWDNGEGFNDFNLNGVYDPPDGLLVTGEDPPLFKGDDMAWWVMNDWDSTHHSRLWSTAPLGIEAQVLIYTRDDHPIYENIQFRTITLVNKSGLTIDSTYYGGWSDVDLGSAIDDAVGCDSARSLGYIFNGYAHDYSYGITPPAVGYQILQGALTSSPGDTVFYNNIPYPDHTMEEMTVFVPILKHSFPFNDPATATEAYSLIKGKGINDQPIYDPLGYITTFPFSGDPVNNSGWLALDYMSPGDRQLMTSTGPFTMPPWNDTNDNGIAEFGEPGVQIIHTALIFASGANNLDAITNLKYMADFIEYQFIHENETSIQISPILSASSYTQEILLNWNFQADLLESNQINDYLFEGYNLYQGPTIEGPWTRLKTYDVENGVGIIMDKAFDEHGLLIQQAKQFGEDKGLENFTSIHTDALADNTPLVNNKLYHFAIDAYSYSEDALPKTIQSEKQVVSIRPHWTHDGLTPAKMLTYNGPEYEGVSLEVEVRDPSKLTGQDYEIGFNYDSTQDKGNWHFIRKTGLSIDTLIQSDWFSGVYSQHYPTYYDGFDLLVNGVSFDRPHYNSTWEQTNNIEGTQYETLVLEAVSPGGVDSLAWTDESRTQMVHMDTIAGYGNYYDHFERPDLTNYFTLYRESPHDVRVYFGSNYGTVDGDRLADIPNMGGGSEDIEFLQGDLEIRFTEMGQLATRYLRRANDTLIHIPFEVWDIERNIQLCLAIKDNNKTGGIQDTSLSDWEHTLDLDWVVVFDADYATHRDDIQPMMDNPISGWTWQFAPDSKFSIGDVVLLRFRNPVKAGEDVYTWTTNTGPSSYDEDALELINVFPNPFFGNHRDQLSVYDPYVTFSNLPNAECTIRIYSLGGHLVRRFDHMIGTYESWDLLNANGSMVASGMYIVHVEVEGVGDKVLKMAVFQPER